jgi:hypothetical protein
MRRLHFSHTPAAVDGKCRHTLLERVSFCRGVCKIMCVVRAAHHNSCRDLKEKKDPLQLPREYTRAHTSKYICIYASLVKTPGLLYALAKW